MFGDQYREYKQRVLDAFPWRKSMTNPTLFEQGDAS
jgi:hypothetical protein